MLADTVEKLRTVALDATDASGYFPAMYARVTRAVDDGISTGRFEDGNRMAEFARSFAGRYLVPRAGTPPIPGCWRAAWDVSGDGHLLIVQHLLLGVNAHVNHDLPLVVVDLATARDIPLAEMRPDFDSINSVLAETQPAVLADLGRLAAWVNAAASMGGGRVFNFSLTVARDQAWRAATRLYPLDESERAAEVAELDRLVRVLAYLITRPAPPLGLLVPLARMLERRDPVEVTRALLGPLA